jgi:NADPH:quinone reductase-like Zn-dependent oxidoreductase
MVSIARSAAALVFGALVVAAMAAAGMQTGTPTTTEGRQTMKAVRIHQFGGPEVLTYEDAPRPEPGEGEVLIRVHAAGVNPVDWKTRQHGFRRKELPAILGWDASGVIEAVGPGASKFKPGDEVYAMTDLARDGTYAEFVVTREDAVALKPRTLDHVQAAAVPLAALTAWQAMFDTAGLKEGQTVLIHGAAGGVGHLAVQLAKARGARVIGTASAGNHEFLKRLGCDEVIDYRTTRFEDAVKDADVVLDTVGGETLERSYDAVKPGGFVVSIIGQPSEEKARERGVGTARILVRPNGEQLAEIGALIDAGKVKPEVGHVFPLAEAAKAHEQSQSGHTRGKIVLKVVEE